MPTTVHVLGLTALCMLATKGMANNSDIHMHPNWPRETMSECGISAADRIVGGKNATLGQYPWLARLGIRREFGLRKYVERNGLFA